MTNNNSFQSNGDQSNRRQAQGQERAAAPKPQNTTRALPPFGIETLTKDLFDGIADKCAKTIADCNDSTNKPTQLRRFYDELVMWNERAAKTEQAFNDVLPFVYMMKSKVAYAKGRKNVDETFKTFFNDLIDQINDQRTLNNAKLFMEAVMGFYKQYKKD